MKRNVLFILCSILMTVGFASAQTERRTITNFDLEKYKQQRLEAERDLRENYEQLGFPSPEELEAQRKEADLERERLAENLRRERLEREQFYYEQQYLQTSNTPDIYLIQNSGGYRSFPFYRSGYYSYPPRHGGRSRNSNPYFKNGIGPVGGGFFGPRMNPYQNNRSPLNRKRSFPTNPNPRQGGNENPR